MFYNQKLKQSDANNFVFLLLSPHMERYFHKDYAKQTCVKTKNESEKCGKSRADFWEKKSQMFFIDVQVLDSCCCAKNIVMC